MRSLRATARCRYPWITGLFILMGSLGAEKADQKGSPGLLALVPQVENWTLAGEPRNFFPDNLFEYIDGAAESYLAYDFKELVTAEFLEAGGKTSLTLEIYDMGNDRNAFGVYSTESFPESARIGIGNQGYVDGEALNFISGRNYIKLLCFNGGEQTANLLETFARQVDGRISERGSLPPLLSALPAAGRVSNSEKFIRRNVLGFEFLNDGYLASYKIEGKNFDIFLIETARGQDPRDLLKRLLDFFSVERPNGAETVPFGYRLRTQYMQNIYLGVSGRFIGGAIRVPDGAETAGEASFRSLMKSLEGFDGC